MFGRKKTEKFYVELSPAEVKIFVVVDFWLCPQTAHLPCQNQLTSFALPCLFSDRIKYAVWDLW